MTGLPDMPVWAAPAFAIPDTYERLDCGCVSWNQVHDGKKIFLMRPCSLTCEYYLFALGESQKQGNTIEYRRYG